MSHRISRELKVGNCRVVVFCRVTRFRRQQGRQSTLSLGSAEGCDFLVGCRCRLVSRSRFLATGRAELSVSLFVAECCSCRDVLMSREVAGEICSSLAAHRSAPISACRNNPLVPSPPGGVGQRMRRRPRSADVFLRNATGRIIPRGAGKNEVANLAGLTADLRAERRFHAKARRKGVGREKTQGMRKRNMKEMQLGTADGRR